MKKTIIRTATAFLIAACVVGFAPMAGDGPAFAASKAPAKVTGVTLQVNAQPTATLQWKAVGKNADGYLVYRNGKKLADVKTGATAYIDRTLKPGASYSYTVKAYNKTKKKTFLGKASAASKIEKGYTWGKAADGKAMVTGYTGHQSEVTIPSKHDGKKVTEVGQEAFQGNLFIKTLKIPGSVKRIDDYAFETCSGMKKVYFPKSLKYIGDGAFSGCAQMRLADLADGVTHIGTGAFLYCMDLAYIEIPADLTELGNFAFAGSGISRVWFSENGKLQAIPDRTFCNCGKLSGVTIPAGITAVNKRAFSGCENLVYAEFAGQTISIDNYVFEKCPDLVPYFAEGSEVNFGEQIFANDPQTIREANQDIDFPDEVFIPKPEEPDYSGWPDPGQFSNKPTVVSREIKYTSAASDGIFDPEKFAGYMDIEEGFDAWVEKYKEYNKDLPMTAAYNPFLSLYTGEDHYRQMKAVLNHDEGRWAYAVRESGDDFEQMYLMMDHGLTAELSRGKMPQDLILYSGLKSEQVACFAGYPQGQRKDVTVPMQKLVELVGAEVMDEAYLSTSASIETAVAFAEPPANALVKVYASQEALDRLGTVCVDPFSTFSGEHEILFNDHAHYTVMDVGEVTIEYSMSDGSKKQNTRTCIMLELK